MMKILVISLAGIGDTLLATPMIQALRKGYPDARIDALVMWRGAKQLLEGNPHLNNIFQENLLQTGFLKGLSSLWRYRREKYDLSLNTYPQGKIIYRGTAWYIHAQRRLSHLHENRSWLDHWLVTDTLEQNYQIHCIENNLNLLGLLGLPILNAQVPEIYFSPSELEWADTFSQKHRLNEHRVLGVQVGSGKTKNLVMKRWPVESYIDVIDRLVKDYPGLKVLLFGGPEEKELNERILQSVPSDRVLQVPSRTMKEAAAMLKHCELFLSVDNAFMHLAAAMQVPSQIVIESPTFNKTIEPYQRPFSLVRNPMVGGRNLEYYRYDGRNIRGSQEHLLACMRSITPQMVFEVLAEKLSTIEKSQSPAPSGSDSPVLPQH